MVGNLGGVAGGGGHPNQAPSTTGGIKEEEMNNGLKCTFSRGYCQVHLIQGKKRVIKSKKWGKKSNNTFGWLYRQTVVFECGRSADFSSLADSTSVQFSTTSVHFNRPGEGNITAGQYSIQDTLDRRGISED